MSTHASTCKCEHCDLRDLFMANLSDSVADFICTQKIEREYTKGQTIISEGDTIQDFMYLQSGLVKLSRKGRFQDEIICFARPYDFVSLLSIFSEKTYNYSVVALENSITCSLEINTVKKMITENGTFALTLIEKMSHATDKIILTTLKIRQRRLMGRIAYILQYFADEVYHSSTFELPVSRKEIAEFIGMTTENVIRTLSEFKKDGIISIDGKIINILDNKKLEKISNTN